MNASNNSNRDGTQIVGNGNNITIAPPRYIPKSSNGRQLIIVVALIATFALFIWLADDCMSGLIYAKNLRTALGTPDAPSLEKIVLDLFIIGINLCFSFVWKVPAAIILARYASIVTAYDMETSIPKFTESLAFLAEKVLKKNRTLKNESHSN